MWFKSSNRDVVMWQHSLFEEIWRISDEISQEIKFVMCQYVKISFTDTILGCSMSAQKSMQAGS